MTSLAEHLAALTKYERMGSSHFYVTWPIVALLATTGKQYLEAWPCVRCRGRGWTRGIYGMCCTCGKLGYSTVEAIDEQCEDAEYEAPRPAGRVVVVEPNHARASRSPEW